MIIQNITSCEQTFSSSLHGLIVSHAYGIPSVWCNFYPNKPIAGDNVKFRDYFSSVDIDYYDPIPIEINNYIREKGKLDINNIISPNQAKVSIRKVIEIQQNLLNVTPFKIDKKHEYNTENAI